MDPLSDYGRPGAQQVLGIAWMLLGDRGQGSAARQKATSEQPHTRAGSSLQLRQ